MSARNLNADTGRSGAHGSSIRSPRCNGSESRGKFPGPRRRVSAVLGRTQTSENGRYVNLARGARAETPLMLPTVSTPERFDRSTPGDPRRGHRPISGRSGRERAARSDSATLGGRLRDEQGPSPSRITTWQPDRRRWQHGRRNRWPRDGDGSERGRRPRRVWKRFDVRNSVSWMRLPRSRGCAAPPTTLKHLGPRNRPRA